NFGFQGCSAAVDLPGQPTWLGTSGSSYAGVPITSDLLFAIGSNTKTFTAALVLQLVDRGLLSLDAPLSSLLPQHTNVNPRITVRQLLDHTSGLFDYMNDDAAQVFAAITADRSRIWTPEEILSTFFGPPHFAPGASWRYSNTNFLIAGMIDEAVIGSTDDTDLRRSI